MQCCKRSRVLLSTVYMTPACLYLSQVLSYGIPAPLDRCTCDTRLRSSPPRLQAVAEPATHTRGTFSEQSPHYGFSTPKGIRVLPPKWRQHEIMKQSTLEVQQIDHQSRPSKRPSPLTADVLKIAQSLFLISGSPRPSATAASSSAPGRSCRRRRLHVTPLLKEGEGSPHLRLRTDLSSSCPRITVLQWRLQAASPHAEPTKARTYGKVNAERPPTCLLAYTRMPRRNIPRHPWGCCLYLLVGVHQDEGVGQLVLRQDVVELLPRDADALRVAAVHHVDDGLRVGVCGSTEYR